MAHLVVPGSTSEWLVIQEESPPGWWKGQLLVFSLRFATTLKLLSRVGDRLALSLHRAGIRIRHAWLGARPAVLMVSRVGADGEAARLVRSAASEAGA